MKPHQKRFEKIARHAIPPVKLMDKELVKHIMKEIDQDPEKKEQYLKIIEKTKTMLMAQYKNGAGMPMDSLIREFYAEYNDRNMKYGPTLMPSSFNVMEAFMQFDWKYNYFSLRKENDHLLSFIEFLDFVTSNELEDIKEAIEYLEEGIIYSYNFINNPADFIITSNNGAEYGICGASLVKYESEISIILLAGEKADLNKETEILSEIEETLSRPQKGLIKPNPGLKREAVAIDEDNSMWKIIALTRIDVEDLTLNIRYIMKDIGNSYIVSTDDINSFVKSNGEFITEEDKQLAVESSNQLNVYNALFNTCTFMVYLPIYFEKYGEYINEERHKTMLGMERNKKNFDKKKKLINPSDRLYYRSVSVLHRELYGEPDLITYNSSDFKIETAGFYRQLPIDHVGNDKYGRPIHGKTWVKKQLTWIDNEISTLTVKKVSKEQKQQEAAGGYIYVMRNASHYKDIFKIGLTTRSSQVRAEELSRTTGSPDKFLVVEEWGVNNCSLAEKLIHNSLDKYRVNKDREFFQAPYQIIHEEINKIVKTLNS